MPLIYQVGWQTFDDWDQPNPFSKTHYYEEGTDRTLCGITMPHYTYCDSEGIGSCKRCAKIAAKPQYYEEKDL